jgi:protein TonB
MATHGIEDAGRTTEAHGTGTTVEVPPTPPREPGESESVPHDEEPIPIFHPDPEYPGWARESGVQGTVQLHVLVGLDGLVKRVVIRKDVIGLGDAARAGIARWTFRPAMFHGHPVAVWILIPVRFWLQ